MNIDDLIHDLRARINPQYFDQPGTESYERHQVVMALEQLREENERLRGIERAAQWYVDNPNSQRIAISQIKAAIDAARGEK